MRGEGNAAPILGTATRRTVLSGLAASSVPLSANVIPRVGPVVETRQGRVAGFVRNGACVFLGLPYGAPTGGERRFLPPVLTAPWDGVRDAHHLGQRAPQPPGRIYESPLIGPYMTGGRQSELIAMEEPEGEDCLVLNVLTPSADRRRRPVMVYIHGGGFTSGSGAVMSLCDRFALEQDIVLVTVNHRLGALGFLYLGGVSPRYAQGNVGMLDLVAALEWVKANIAGFGGDPDKVTIFGESGGAAKIALLAAMPQAKGLFRAAIMESGLIPRPVAAEAASSDAQAAIAALGGFRDEVGVLLSAPLARLIAAAPGAGPVADGHTLVADPWRNAPEAAAGVPMIIGYCADEATLFAGMPDPSTFSLDWATLPPRTAGQLDVAEDEISPVIAAYRRAAPAANASDVFFRIVSDATFVRSMIAMADLKSAQTPNVYFYRMNYDTGLGPGLRAFHTAELPLVGRLVLQPRAEHLSRHLSAAWGAFARTLDPNAKGFAHWRPHRGGDAHAMMFDAVSAFRADPEAGARKLLFDMLGDRTVPFVRQARS